MSEVIKFEVNKNNVAILTLNDPDKLNALSLRMISAIHDKIKDINSGNTKARCLVITGSGKGFCSGANLFDNKIGSDFSKLDILNKQNKLNKIFGVDFSNVSVKEVDDYLNFSCLSALPSRPYFHLDCPMHLRHPGSLARHLRSRRWRSC